MPKAVWNGQVVAESDETIMVEGSHYFPPDSVHRRYLTESDKTTTSAWKGEASYFDVEVDGQLNRNAAWTYHDPKPKAQHIKDYVAFWGGIKIVP